MQWPSAAINHVAVWAVNGAGGRQDSSRFPNLLRAASPTARKPGTTPGTCRSPPRGHGGFLLLPSAAARADILPVHPWFCSCLWLHSPRGDPSAAARAGAAAQGLFGASWGQVGCEGCPSCARSQGGPWLEPEPVAPSVWQPMETDASSWAGESGQGLQQSWHHWHIPEHPTSSQGTAWCSQRRREGARRSVRNLLLLLQQLQSFFHPPGCPLGTKGAPVPVARQPLPFRSWLHKKVGNGEQQGCSPRGWGPRNLSVSHGIYG